jgi:protein gp37
MSANSAIEWTDHTFNPWWGCVKVSPGCQHCYAETLSKRFGNNIWGPAKTTTRRLFGPKHWQEPLKWERAALDRYQRTGERTRVFCASMADVFEDHPAVAHERPRLWDLIERTPHLDWLLLTKRPENVMALTPWGVTWPHNVWLGTSVEDQVAADVRIPYLLRVPAVVRFLSCEPLLGYVRLFGTGDDVYECPGPGVTLHGYSYESDYGTEWDASIEVGIDWVIGGGESGVGARPCKIEWARALRDECQEHGVAFFWKQWGGRVAKSGGRLLDGVTWSEFPAVEVPA